MPEARYSHIMDQIHDDLAREIITVGLEQAANDLGVDPAHVGELLLPKMMPVLTAITGELRGITNYLTSHTTRIVKDGYMVAAVDGAEHIYIVNEE